MKVRKEASKNGGYHITVEVGGRVWSSYWSAPSESVDHAGLKYLTDRYPIITTEKREEEFKRQYKNLWIEVSPYQLELMQHCIGLNYSKRPYRNRFFTWENDEDWSLLANKGLANKGTEHPNDDGHVYFWLTKQGVEYVLGKSVSDNVYKEL